MKIYVTHSSDFDFNKNLYEPIRMSELNSEHNIVLPHEKSSEQFNSKEYLKECDLVIAEVSRPSTGQGIELGWADIYEVPIICIYKSGTKPSGSIRVVSDKIFEYKDKEDMIRILKQAISSL